MEEKYYHTKRRNVLKTCASSIGIGGLASIGVVSTEAAKQDGFLVGERSLISSKRYYQYTDSNSTGNADGQRRFAVDDSNKQLGLIDDSLIDYFSNSRKVVILDGEFHKDPSTLHPTSTTHLSATPEFNKGSSKTLITETEVYEPRIKLGFDKDRSVTALISEENNGNIKSITVAPDETVETSFSPIQVEIYKSKYTEPDAEADERLKTIDVKPTVIVKNHGKLNVFGKRGYSVVPANSQDGFIDQLVSIESEASGTKLTHHRSQDLIIIEKEVQE